MFLSQKCQYALRALFELSKVYGQGPVKIVQIAKAQAIPQRFLEVILSQLKQGGFVDSQRGNEGGYFLIRYPHQMTIGEVIKFIQGPFGPVNCTENKTVSNRCPLNEGCVFLPMWEKVQKAISDVFNKTSFQDLVDKQNK